MQTARSKAEQKFAKLMKQREKAPQESETAQQKSDDKTARLRALRLAKEAADKAAAERKAAGEDGTASLR